MNVVLLRHIQRRTVITVSFQRSYELILQCGVAFAKRIKPGQSHPAKLPGCGHASQIVIFTRRGMFLDAFVATIYAGQHRLFAQDKLIVHHQPLAEVQSVIAQCQRTHPTHIMQKEIVGIEIIALIAAPKERFSCVVLDHKAG